MPERDDSRALCGSGAALCAKHCGHVSRGGTVLPWVLEHSPRSKAGSTTATMKKTSKSWT